VPDVRKGERFGWAPYLFSLPGLLFIAGLFLLPIAELMISSLLRKTPSGGLAFSLAAYADVWGDSYHYALMWRTIKISAITTFVCFVLAFPVALYMRTLSRRQRSVLGFVLLSPLLTSVVVRTLAWVVLLGPQGLVNGSLRYLGLPPVTLIYNELGVIIGLTHVYLGYMVLSIMTSVSKIDENLFLAASNLGASRWIIIWQIALPLSLPGIVAGSVLVFTMTASAYATPMLLGGAGTKMAATEIYNLAMLYMEWDRATALATILVLVTAAVVLLGTRIGESGRRKAVFQ
jgi:putative spermidine/putrescine transport system permease protein